MNNHQNSSLLHRCFCFLDGLCSAFLALEQNQCPEAFQGRGIVIPESQVEAALSGQCPLEAVPGFEEELEEILLYAERCDEALAGLMRRLQPEGIEVLALLLALAPRVNRKYERIFAYLQDDATAREATLGLCADLWALISPSGEADAFILDDPSRPLNLYGLLPQGSGLSRRLVLQESALYALLGISYLPRELSSLCRVLSAEEPPEILANEVLVRQVIQFSTCALESGEKPRLLQIFGGEGSGKVFLARHVAAAARRPVLLLNCEAWSVLPDIERDQRLQSMASWAFLHDGIPALQHFMEFSGFGEAERKQMGTTLLSAFTQDFPLTILCGEQPEELRLSKQFSSLSISIPQPSIQQQQRCWERFSAQQQLPLDEAVQSRQLATIYSLSSGRIRRTLELAQADALSRGRDTLDLQSISQGVRLICSRGLKQLAQPMEPSFTWEDLEVDELARKQLQELCDRVRYRWQVNEEWGFHKRLPYGKGISVCLYGPPGTGKTMTAQVLAREFGLDAYRVDMSRIMDKYIGETEKKLGALFDAAKDSNSILFFDEADALFAKRTEVGDSKDRYANVETAYLLQRMENHNGISILATNAANNFDAAFKRRINYMIALPMPDVQTRKRLWSKVFPEKAPVENFNLDELAERFELTGSSIKNAALHAAYLAAAAQHEIRREDILRAIQVEYQKTGRLLMENELY